ncbi:MAG: DNA repair protein RecN [Hungatella hathewayi]|uniref:DNA repair protein RecN n=1 Tax=Hungatella hathewayi WAL-18680 TaxID=742737 RepID=G5IBU6_9FIRM|nr:DNA repair protein RecN [Hungatella hathewayi]EHI61064.1 DNA repair protein RecN [ [Hungatella hathewayi WAL-18680]MBS4984750.1 DNA repair protein RecN [Hungatella hathewayi]
MLLDLHVKNLALIERAEISFEEGLNILTGETGAGKSIIIGSVNMALGGKVPKDIIRQGAEYAYVELIFRVTEPEKIALLQAMDVELPEDGTLIISKKIMPSRSVSKINDMTVTAAKLKEITSLLIDIHGQHEHQSLLYKSKHLQILDAYAKSRTNPIKNTIAQTYRSYQELQERIKSLSMDRESRLREADFCRFEIEELENADLREGEEEELTVLYRKFQHGQKIMEGLSAADRALSSESISVALKEVDRVAEFDEALGPIRDQLYDADSIIRDIIHDVSSYIDSFSFDEEEYERIGERLDVIHGLQAKYGDDISDIMVQLEEKRKRLEELENHDMILAELESELAETERMLEAQSQELSTVRQEAAGVLVDRIRQGLEDLNFIDVRFDMKFEKLDHYTSGGYDEAEFLISTNPGEPVRPLGMVASGGELSRIMLAIKAVLADTDEIPTLIFDEIDTGISGRTAQKVSEKLSYIGKSHQVICITHLPQIAAMADAHYEIVKSAVDGRTTTTIRQLDYEQMIQELARLLGGAEITDAVYDNAREMKELAKR